jgi:hypothetical protein
MGETRQGSVSWNDLSPAGQSRIPTPESDQPGAARCVAAVADYTALGEGAHAALRRKDGQSVSQDAWLARAL